MEWGMANRMAQLVQPDGHCLFLPVDHGYFQGPTRKLEEPRKTIEPLLPYADAIFITRGVLRSSVDPDKAKPIILRVSGGTSIFPRAKPPPKVSRASQFILFRSSFLMVLEKNRNNTPAKATIEA